MSHLCSRAADEQSEAWCPGRQIHDCLSRGILEQGFTRVHCLACGKDGLVVFSCSLLLQRAEDLPFLRIEANGDQAAHWLDHVLPDVPVRQWVLSLPHEIRYRIALDQKLQSEVRGVFMRAPNVDDDIASRAVRDRCLGDTLRAFLSRLAALIPALSVNLVTYHGLLAPRPRIGIV